MGGAKGFVLSVGLAGAVLCAAGCNSPCDELREGLIPTLIEAGQKAAIVADPARSEFMREYSLHVLKQDGEYFEGLSGHVRSYAVEHYGHSVVPFVVDGSSTQSDRPAPEGVPAEGGCVAFQFERSGWTQLPCGTSPFLGCIDRPVPQYRVLCSRFVGPESSAAYNGARALEMQLSELSGVIYYSKMEHHEGGNTYPTANLATVTMIVNEALPQARAAEAAVCQVR